MSHARPALLTVFSTTQLELPKTQNVSSHRSIGDEYELLDVLSIFLELGIIDPEFTSYGFRRRSLS